MGAITFRKPCGHQGDNKYVNWAGQSENGENFQFNNLNNNSLRRDSRIFLVFSSQICVMNTISFGTKSEEETADLETVFQTLSFL